MSEVRRLLLVLVVALSLLTCKSRPDNPIAPNPCSSGAGSKHRGAPVVCIDDSASVLTVNPDPVEAFDVNAAGDPVEIAWYTKSGTGDPKISWKNGDCVNSSGNSKAKTKKGAVGKKCKYEVELAGHPKLDPEVVIVRCCSDTEDPNP
ncbi:MAG TPA: hypothetical protein VJZ00_21825 [Thermoanaerobaculia bacterium]|nr:hypothetical protein [Thermoanaerobaculia bacterium]